jgi:hypothetical protein
LFGSAFACALGPAAAPFLGFVGRRVEHLDAFVGQQPDDGVGGVGGQLAAFEGSRDVRHRDGTAFSGPSH